MKKILILAALVLLAGCGGRVDAEYGTTTGDIAVGFEWKPVMLPDGTQATNEDGSPKFVKVRRVREAAIDRKPE